jgi:sulfur-oxidizing protein SoxY
MTTRRQFLIITGGLVAASGVSWPARAQAPRGAPDAMAAAIRELVGEAPVREGKVKLDLPPIVENGNTVSMTVAVDSAMTEAEHVKGIHVFTEKNPQPNVISVKLGPRAGRAEIATRVRLADTQTVTAICEMSDGSFWSDHVEVIITLGACLEDNLI